jgi:hypothetical protein
MRGRATSLCRVYGDQGCLTILRAAPFDLHVLTWRRLRRTGSVRSVLFLAASQNCFCEAYLLMGQMQNRQSRNFLGMLVRSPASGHTTHRSSTNLGGTQQKCYTDKQYFCGEIKGHSYVTTFVLILKYCIYSTYVQ